jgi:pimeloyl-ACP methyl ester carboxylesterase
MRHPRLWLAPLVLALAAGPAPAQPLKEAAVIFKDGFYVKGKVNEKRDFIVDPASGQSFPVPSGSGFIYVDDLVRRIHFSPNQVQEVIPIEPAVVKETMVLRRLGTTLRGNMILPGWSFESVSDWNNKWERTLKVRTDRGQFDMTQRLTLVTPRAILGLSIGYDWDFGYLTQEFGPELTRSLLEKYYRDKKEFKEHEKRLQIATFLKQAGWLEYADKELEEAANEFPDQKDAIKKQREQVRELQGNRFVEDLERHHKLGQHDAAQEQIALYEKEGLDKAVSDKNKLLVADLKTKYEASTTQLGQARQWLRDLPSRTENKVFWVGATKFILDELNLDTVSRLETFLPFAQQHLREIEEKSKLTQTAEEVLALAITGWLQGSTAADPDPKLAEKLFHVRQATLDYLKADTPAARAQALSSFRKYELSPDVFIRLVRLLPPSHPYAEKIESEPVKMSVDLPDVNEGSYYVWTPPDYHPQRSYPVLLLLQSAREKPNILVQRWMPLAAKYGFILAAPVWGQGLRPTYGYTAPEHAAVLDALRDLRRRFNVDSDRVFLFGWEQGANAALDIGLSHPDQFAGVVPMNGSVKRFPERYWPNAQYLPFYLVEGDRNGGYPKATRGVFKDWVRGHYPSMYIEYKGRGSEWYSAELPEMMNWMSRKKRHHPGKEMGRVGGEEFRTSRACDNRFYWLSTDDIQERHINDYRSWVHTTLPATLQANLSIGNEADVKTGAKIWSQFNIRTKGIKQVTLWISAGLIDFSKPVILRVNGDQVGTARTVRPNLETLLEDLYVTGDRQRLVLAKIELKL